MASPATDPMGQDQGQQLFANPSTHNQNTIRDREIKVNDYINSQRGMEMESELKRFQEDRKKIRLQRFDDEANFVKALSDLEKKKEEDVRKKVERNQIYDGLKH
jgi:hypothetical protein